MKTLGVSHQLVTDGDPRVDGQAAPLFCPEEFYAERSDPRRVLSASDREHMIFLFPSFLYIREPPTLTKKGPTLTKKGKIPGQISQKGYDHHKKGKIVPSWIKYHKKGKLPQEK